MSRNKFPEKTITHILEIATTLFMEKGYEKTTIQDIINASQMSKGAIYHHFRSKEEILQAVIGQRNAYAKKLLLSLVRNTTAKNAKEKLIKILETTISDKRNHALDSILLDQIQNPQFVVAGMQSSMLDDSPIIATLFEEGIEDGSFTCTSPAICAEVFIFLMNVWITPSLFSRSKEQTQERLEYLQKVLETLGADIITDVLIQQIVNSYQDMGAFVHK